jgi:hypothetical protein
MAMGLNPVASQFGLASAQKARALPGSVQPDLTAPELRVKA